MQVPVPHVIQDQTFWLSAERCLYWEAQKALIVSDLHFGKTGHFRKWGIGVPQNIFKEDLQRLVNLVQLFGAQQVIAVGDLFHSKANLELELFKRWRHDLPHLQFRLVKGNHDILSNDWYADAAIEVTEGTLGMGNIYFSHEDCMEKEGAFTFCGHLHPGVVIHGAGRQSLRFPCFYFTDRHCILPAFSRFTGTATVRPQATDAVFAIVEDSLLKL